MSKDTFQIQCVADAKCGLGEGPVWNKRERKLYWVDIYAGKIYRYDPATQVTMSWSAPEYIGFLIFKSDNRVIGGLKSGLHQLLLNDDGSVTATRIDTIDEGSEHIRFNDATLDSAGGIWACTMDIQCKAPLGKYFYYDNEFNRTVVDEKYVVGNGPALSPDEKLLYTIETMGDPEHVRGVYVFDITSSTTAQNKRLLIQWEEPDTYPDGIVTDASGNLWIGVYGSNVLRCFGQDGKMIREIPVPAWNITKAAFANDRQDILYVTSARSGADEDTLARYPLTGGVFEISNFR